jgi:hypothetical protein
MRSYELRTSGVSRSLLFSFNNGNLNARTPMDDVEDRPEDLGDMDGGAASRKFGALSTTRGRAGLTPEGEFGRVPLRAA